MISDIILVVILALACVYTLVSAVLIYSAVSRITGKELKHMMVALFITIVAGFFYGLFQLLVQLGIVNTANKLALQYASNFVLFTMFVMLVYLSFLARELGRRFGFRFVGKKIKKKLEPKKAGKHSL